MLEKKILAKAKTRKIPKSFGFVDHRLVRDRHIDRLSHKGAALYLFLVTVADADGLSYYGDKSICKRLQMEQSELKQARQNLIQTGLIAYEAPLYQLLGLDVPERAKPVFKESGSARDLTAVKDILRKIAGEA